MSEEKERTFLLTVSKGYTSLGGKLDTHPNPHLKGNETGDVFRPAYELLTDDGERLGRDS
jgi:FAD synthetase